jgi:hypothetical protein
MELKFTEKCIYCDKKLFIGGVCPECFKKIRKGEL